jgi:hypothetical protein
MISFKGLSIVNLDFSSFDNLFLVIVEKFCEHTKLIEVVRSQHLIYLCNTHYLSITAGLYLHPYFFYTGTVRSFTCSL